MLRDAGVMMMMMMMGLTVVGELEGETRSGGLELLLVTLVITKSTR